MLVGGGRSHARYANTGVSVIADSYQTIDNSGGEEFKPIAVAKCVFAKQGF
jgi:hypothetical protein